MLNHLTDGRDRFQQYVIKGVVSGSADQKAQRDVALHRVNNRADHYRTECPALPGSRRTPNGLKPVA